MIIVNPPESIAEAQETPFCPPYTKGAQDGVTYYEMRDGDLLHSETDPALIAIHPDGSRIESWYKQGVLHSGIEAALQEFYPNGSIEKESWYCNGALHHEKGPAVIEYNYNDLTQPAVKESYYINNKLQRETDYAFNAATTEDRYYTDELLSRKCEYQPDGSLFKDSYYMGGLLHREGNPTVTEYDKNGRVIIETWYNRSALHRENEPAITEWYDNGHSRHVRQKCWYSQGKLHRVGGPAVLEYTRDGKPILEEHYIKNNLHRDGDEPAVIKFNHQGEVIQKRWYVHGELHRDGTNKSAVIDYDGNGQATMQKAYTNGTYSPNRSEKTNGNASHKHAGSASPFTSRRQQQKKTPEAKAAKWGRKHAGQANPLRCYSNPDFDGPEEPGDELAR